MRLIQQSPNFTASQPCHIAESACETFQHWTELSMHHKLDQSNLQASGQDQPHASTSGRSPDNADSSQREPSSSGSQSLQLSASNSPAARVLSPPSSSRVSRVRFWLQFHAQFGQQVRIVGSHEVLGRS